MVHIVFLYAMILIVMVIWGRLTCTQNSERLTIKLILLKIKNVNQIYEHMHAKHTGHSIDPIQIPFSAWNSGECVRCARLDLTQGRTRVKKPFQ